MSLNSVITFSESIVLYCVVPKENSMFKYLLVQLHPPNFLWHKMTTLGHANWGAGGGIGVSPLQRGPWLAHFWHIWDPQNTSG